MQAKVGALWWRHRFGFLEGRRNLFVDKWHGMVATWRRRMSCSDPSSINCLSPLSGHTSGHITRNQLQLFVIANQPHHSPALSRGFRLYQSGADRGWGQILNSLKSSPQSQRRPLDNLIDWEGLTTYVLLPLRVIDRGAPCWDEEEEESSPHSSKSNKTFLQWREWTREEDSTGVTWSVLFGGN